MSAWQEEDGYGVGEGLSDATEGVFGAGAALHGEDADLLAVLDAAEAVGDVDAGALLPAHDGAYAFEGGLVYEGLRGEAGHPLDAFGLQDFRYCSVAVHGVSLLVSGSCGPGMGTHEGRPYVLVGRIGRRHYTRRELGVISRCGWG